MNASSFTFSRTARAALSAAAFLAAAPGVRANDAQNAPYPISLFQAADIIRDEASELRKAEQNDVFLNHNSEDALKALEAHLAKPVAPWGKAGFTPTGEDEKRKRTATEYCQGIIVIDRELRPAVQRVVSLVVAKDFPRRRWRLRRAYGWVDYHEFSKKLGDIDAMLEKYRDYVKKLRPDQCDVTGSELQTLVGFGSLTDANGKMSAALDKELRTLDNYLYAMRREELQKFKDDMAAIEAARLDAQVIRDRLDTVFKETFASTFPTFQPMLHGYGMILAMCNEMVTSTSQTIKDIESTSTEVGMVRKCVGFTPYRHLGWERENGCPVYIQRVRLAFTQCREFFEKTVKPMNDELKKQPGNRQFRW